MSEEEVIKAIHYKIVKFLVANYSVKEGDNTSLEIRWDENDPSVQFTLAAHLKFFISSIIQYMTFYKKKHVLFCPALNGKDDPRMSDAIKSSGKMSSVIAYESTPFTAKDFFQLLKNNQRLIPKRKVYHACIERLLKLDSMKPVTPSDEKMEIDSVKPLVPSDKKRKKSLKGLKQS